MIDYCENNGWFEEMKDLTIIFLTISWKLGFLSGDFSDEYKLYV
jgi:hypothetical protein